MDWARITVTTAQEASEAVANLLFELNATGVELKDNEASTVNLIAHYPLDDRVGARMQKLRDFLTELPTWGIQPHPATIDLKHVKSEKWEEAWKSAFPPQRVGSRIVIAPTWIDVPHNETEILIQLNPGMAFGTGYHPTTRLSLELLERTVEPHHQVADIGTGSGILTIAAIKLGAKHVDAIEIDPTAIPIAAANFQANGVAPKVHLSQGDGLRGIENRYHLIIGNILTKTILPMIPFCVQRIYPEGIIIFSGILETEFAQVKSVLEANQFQCLEVVSEAEDKVTWVGIKAAQ
ncbi:Ribosomal protein L11 methyltransferase [Geodia barretti]|uniref:ETFB lysine methyltransferase n=1 Tax=Geodia barretti TaxID=519541 RepID=A0AA35SE89_GEOBA|nr:Ribosomal protein L11 methyltransferase [Geodia barretti]